MRYSGRKIHKINFENLFKPGKQKTKHERIIAF